MDLGLTLGWTNAVMLFAFGIIALVARRAEKIRWLVIYAMVYPFLSVLYKSVPLFYNYYFWNLFRYIEFFLILCAVIDILRVNYKLTWSQIWWVLPALLGIIFGAADFRIPYLSYYGARIFFLCGLAFTLRFALKKSDKYILSFGLLAAGLLISDLMKLVSTGFQIELMQVQLDTFIFLINRIALLFAILEPELFRLKNTLMFALNKAGLNSLINKPVESSHEKDNINKTFKAIKYNKILKKQKYFSPVSLMEYLGLYTFNDVEAFLDLHKIKREEPGETPHCWLVRKENVDNILKKQIS